MNAAEAHRTTNGVQPPAPQSTSTSGGSGPDRTSTCWSGAGTRGCSALSAPVRRHPKARGRQRRSGDPLPALPGSSERHPPLPRRARPRHAPQSCPGGCFKYGQWPLSRLSGPRGGVACGPGLPRRGAPRHQARERPRRRARASRAGRLRLDAGLCEPKSDHEVAGGLCHMAPGSSPGAAPVQGGHLEPGRHVLLPLDWPWTDENCRAPSDHDCARRHPRAARARFVDLTEDAESGRPSDERSSPPSHGRLARAAGGRGCSPVHPKPDPANAARVSAIRASSSVSSRATQNPSTT